MAEEQNNESGKPVDAIFQMLLHTLRELWVIKDRQLILERVLDEAGINVSEAVQNYQPDAEFGAKLDKERREMLDRCMQPAADD
jgi:hypothetical protein